MSTEGCRVYWGSHGCDRPLGHRPPHACLTCWEEGDDEGYVGLPPYYGWRTRFYGEDVSLWLRVRSRLVGVMGTLLYRPTMYRKWRKAKQTRRTSWWAAATAVRKRARDPHRVIARTLREEAAREHVVCRGFPSERRRSND